MLSTAATSNIDNVNIDKVVSKKQHAKQIPHYAIWIQFYPTKDKGISDFFFATYKFYCENVSRQYCRTRLPQHSILEETDILQLGYIGLLKAISTFDPYRGVAFETHAYPRIRGEIIDGLRSTQEFPRIIAKIRRELRPLIEELSSKLQRTPNVEELIESFPRFHINGVSIVDLLQDRLVYVNVFNQLNESSNDDDSANSLETILFKQARSNENTFSKINRVDFIAEILKRLDDKDEETVIFYYYFAKLTIPRISEVMNLSQSCVSLKRISAIERLKSIARTDESFINIVFGG